MRRWLFYHILAWHDIIRLWSATQHQVVIIAGICLPILLLLGLKQGHVAELRKDLLTSPSGRQIVLWSAQGGRLLDEQVINDLVAQVPGSDIVIPETQRTVKIESVTNQGGGASDSEQGLVTLYSTVQGDPVLAQYQADVVSDEQPAVVLTEPVADRVGVKPGESVSIMLRRRRESVEENHVISVRVAALIPGGDDGSQIGYAHLSFLRNLEQYVRGHAVPQYELPAIRGLSARDDYYRYLLFCQRGSQTELQADDFRFFEERGIEWRELEDADEKSLLGVLNRERLNELKVFELQQRPVDGVATPLRLSPLFISENTVAIDDFVLRWNPPLDVKTSDQPCQLVGLSLPTTTQTGGWIHDYLVKEVGFDFEKSQAMPFAVQALGDNRLDSTVLVSLPDGTEIELDGAGTGDLTKDLPTSETSSGLSDRPSDAVPVETGAPSKRDISPSPESLPETVSGPEVANPALADESETPSVVAAKGKDEVVMPAEKRLTLIVPANLLAWLHGHVAGHCRYDARGRVFAPLAEAVVYDKARLYTQTIDDVPNAVRHLSENGYAVLSEGNRIAEIQSQDQSLQLLVVVVAVGVLFFGVITVVSVLVDSTDRKRGTIGILRVMGMSRFGIFYVVVVRALFIGLLAALLSLALGYGFAWLLGSGPEGLGWKQPWRPINVVFQEADLAIVCIGALICSGVGALVPAWRAGAIDPFDAIIEGRFH